MLPEESNTILQTLLGFIRKRKAFTLPKGRVECNAYAFGRVTADIGYALRREGNSMNGWLPRINKDGSYRDNIITDYLRRLLNYNPNETLQLAEKIWDKFLTSQFILVEKKGKWKLDHERLFVTKPTARYVCSRCSVITTYSAKQCCPHKGCRGKLEEHDFDPTFENIIARWVVGDETLSFTTLKSEEHTAQINKDLAKKIEDKFRADGVNLLSSTTTFEMGINIGNLQKVLLRNAPPSSASYVQRVGRAGRGGDKNAVCVTLCRRTKYDADAWRNPTLLMSGEVRTPTVFTQNRIIAQRHFNALVFARFLRIEVSDEKRLGTELKQQIPLDIFLSNDTRSQSKIPEKWISHQQNILLDFTKWLEQQGENEVFCTKAGHSLLEALSGFSAAINETNNGYEKIMQEIAAEILELMTERNKLYQQGDSTDNIDRAVKNLLSNDIIAVLAKRGFLPRYAFPLDVVTLETGLSRWARNTDVDLSRDRAIAIAEFAPGAQVIAHKKVFTSAGLYVVGSMDKPERKWYSRCPSCEQIRTSATKEPLAVNCLVCGRSISKQYIKPFVEPAAFSVQIEKKSDSGERHRRTSLIRQRQSLTHFIDSVTDEDFKNFGLFLVALKENGKLFRYNLGPENKGFVLCPNCGYSKSVRSFKTGKPHKRLRSLGAGSECANSHPWTKLAYGHQFESFCLIIRSTLPIESVESIAYALQKGLCNLLELEFSDIGVSWRWLVNPKRAEIILYDHTPGGAGFVKEGFDSWEKVVEKAHKICETCDCEKACYNCLKNYSNQSYYEKLDRRKVMKALEK